MPLRTAPQCLRRSAIARARRCRGLETRLASSPPQPPQHEGATHGTVRRSIRFPAAPACPTDADRSEPTAESSQGPGPGPCQGCQCGCSSCTTAAACSCSCTTACCQGGRACSNSSQGGRSCSSSSSSRPVADRLPLRALQRLQGDLPKVGDAVGTNTIISFHFQKTRSM